MFRKKRLLALILILGMVALILSGCFPERVTIRFDAMGGNSVAPIKVKADADMLELPVPVREGFTFNYWCYDVECTQKVDLGTIPIEETLFYAKWVEKIITVTFNSSPRQYVNLPYGSNLLLKDMPPVLPEKDGFKGIWKTDDLINLRTDLTIEPDYIALRSSVTYFVNTEIYHDDVGEPGLAIVPPADPEFDGQFFYGWFYDEDFNFPCTVLPTEIGATAITLYAKFADLSDMSRYVLYQSNGIEITITGLTPVGKNQKDIVIPAEIDGLPVTKIGTAEDVTAKIGRVFVSDVLETVALPDSVKTVGNFAFYGLESLKTLKLNFGLTTIGTGAFADCTALKAVSIPKSVTVIGDYAFAGMKQEENGTLEFDSSKAWAQEPWNYASSALSSVVFAPESSLISMGVSVFFNTTALQMFTLPDSVAYTLDNRTFEESYIVEFFSDGLAYASENGAIYSADFSRLLFVSNRKAGTFAVHELTTRIDSYAFYRNNGLTSVILSDTVQSVGDYAFARNSTLATVSLSNTSALAEIGRYAFAYCNSLRTLSLPSGLTTIGESTFRASGLTAVTFAGDALTQIPAYAFYECLLLTSVNLPNGVTTVGESAFYGCTKLSELLISSDATLSKIDRRAFADCLSLTVVTLPTSLKVLGEEAFAGLNGKSTLELGTIPALTHIGNRAFFNTAIRRFTVNTAIQSFGEGVFKNCTSLTNVRFPQSPAFTAVPRETFYGCTALTDVTFTENILSVGDFAFYGCAKLRAVSYGQGASHVRSIGISAFENCTDLTTGSSFVLTLPSSLTTLGERAYFGCTSINEIVIPPFLTQIQAETFAYCSGLKKITFAAGNTTSDLGERSFAHCTSLTEASLPVSLAPRNDDNTSGAVMNPFIGCSQLISFSMLPNPNYTVKGGTVYRNLPDNTESVYLYPTGKGGAFDVGTTVSKIDDYAFYGAMVASLTFAHNTVINGVESVLLVHIGKFAFANSALTAVNLSRRVNFVGESAFMDSALTVINIDATLITPNDSAYRIVNTSLGTDNYTTFDKRSFANVKLSSLLLPSRVTKLGVSAFSDCYQLSRLEFTEGDTALEIGDSAFYNNNALTSLLLPKNVVRIGKYAFARCSNVETLIFAPSTMGRVIDAYAFLSCHYLYSIQLPSDLTFIGEGAFSDNTRLSSVLFAPESSSTLAIPKEAFFGNVRLKHIELPSFITSVGERAFYNGSLKTVVFTGTDSNASLEIKESAFEGNIGLSAIQLPAHLVAVGKYAFYRTGLAEVDILPNANSTSLIFSDYAFAKTPLRNFVFDARVTELGKYSFSETPYLETVDFTASILTSIGDYAFFQSGIQKVILPDTVSSVGKYAFAETHSLQSFASVAHTYGAYAFFNSSLSTLDSPFTFSDTLTFNEGVFFGTTRLHSLSLTANKMLIGDFAFASSAFSDLSLSANSFEIGQGIAYNSRSLSEMKLDDKSSTYEIIDGVLYRNESGGSTLVQYPSGKTGAVLELMSTVIAVAPYAFYGNPYLTSINVDNAEKINIGEFAFAKTNVRLGLYVAEDRLEDYADVGIPVSVATAEYGGLVLKRLSGDRYTVTGYVGYDTEITVPGKILVGDKTIRISTISPYAFANNTSILSVIIGDGVSEIGDYAFADCTSLTSVTFGASVLNVKNHAFYRCSSLQTIAFNAGLDRIEDYAFADCSALQRLVLPTMLETVGKFAFSNDVLLAEIVLNDKVTFLDDNAFENCLSLVSVKIPSSVTRLGNRVFSGSENLTYVYMASERVPKLSSNDSFARLGSSLKFFVPENAVKNYKSDVYWRLYSAQILSYSDISNAVGLENYALSRLPDGTYRLVAYIGTEDDVTLLSASGNIIISEIGEYSFGKFTLSVSVQEGYRKINANAFRNAINLVKIQLPDSLQSVGTSAFDGLKNLTSVEFANIGQSVLTEIGSRAFYNCEGLTTFTVPSKVTTIGSFAFSGDLMNLTDVTFTQSASSVIVLGAYAFANNVRLMKLEFNCAVRELGDGAFSNCVSLYGLYLNSTGKVIANIATASKQVFAGCDQLSVFVPSDAVYNAYLSSWASHPYDRSRLVNKSNIASDYLNDQGVLVVQNGFVIAPIAGSTSVATVVSYIGNATHVVFPSSVVIAGSSYKIERIGRDDNNNVNISNGKVIRNTVTHVTIPSSVKIISGDAFRNAKSLQEVRFAPNSALTTVGSHAFAYSPLLRYAEFPKTLALLGKFAFAGCVSLEDVRIENITSSFDTTELLIDISAFTGCTSLKSITLPKQLKTLGQQAFEDCTSLANVIFPSDSKTYIIGQYAFSKTALVSLELPSSMESVQAYAFNACHSLTSVYINRELGGTYNSLTVAAETVFSNIASPFVKIYVPERSYGSYKDSTGWSRKTVIPNLRVDNFNYRMNAGGSHTVTLTNYLGKEKNLVIPIALTIDGVSYRVTTIASYAGNANITSLSFEAPSNVTNLENFAFADCTSLQSAHLANGIQNLGENAFFRCTSLTDLKLPSALSNLSAYAFSGCSALEEVYVPESVATIGNAAFFNCVSLNRLRIGFATATPLGLSALTNTHPNLVIIVPKDRSNAFANQWNAFAHVIFDTKAIYGDLVFEETSQGMTLVQYNGHAATLDLRNLLFNGKHVTNVRPNAAVFGTTILL